MSKNNKNIAIFTDLTINSCLTKYSLLISEKLKSRGINTTLVCINNSIPTPNIENVDCVLQFVPEDNFVYLNNVQSIGVTFCLTDHYRYSFVNDLILLPEYIYSDSKPSTEEKLNIPQIAGEYIFYTINDSFFLSRTNFLIEAFFREFDPSEPINLIIKTNSQIDDYVQEIKKDLKLYSNLEIYKKIIVLTGVMPYSDIELLHNTGDCFVFTDFGKSYYNDILNHGNRYIDLHVKQEFLRKKMRESYSNRNYTTANLTNDAMYNLENVLNKIERVIYES